MFFAWFYNCLYCGFTSGVGIIEGIGLYLGVFSRFLGIFFNASTSTQCMIRTFDEVFSVYDSVVSALF